ncbi:hypothetical protein Nepgr_010758 [Nepenthes gracilis]|uniref:Uncharacterized protein n=1 Tax=Nepenthes gracilis TaxID=150966 RepID=A0AAD3SD03_NEPGR|nr:hypothetical protein Nepgr_010758 [Nepenthes gracilis]
MWWIMDLNENPNHSMKMEWELDDKEVTKRYSEFNREFELLERCIEMKETGRNAEERFLIFKPKIENKNSEFELLETKFKALQAEKVALEEEVKVLREKNQDLEERIACIVKEKGVVERNGELLIDDGEVEREDESKVVQLMIEIDVLQCEKNYAEQEVENWKKKCRDLELRVVRLEEKSGFGGIKCTSIATVKSGKVDFDERFESRGKFETSENANVDDVGAGLHILCVSEGILDCAEVLHASGAANSTCKSPNQTPRAGQVGGMPLVLTTPCNDCALAYQESKGNCQEGGVKHGSHARKRLAFDDDRGFRAKKMAPSTPAGVRCTSVGVIDVCDSDNDDNISFSATSLRKCAAKIVTSESEDDDNIPISQLKRKHLQDPNSFEGPPGLHLNNCTVAYSYRRAERRADSITCRRRRLVKLRHRKETGGVLEAKYHSGTETDEHVDEDDWECGADLSDTDCGSLRNFIVESSDVSDGTGNSFEPEDSSDRDIDFKEILSGLRRRNPKLKWEFEGDMLAAFGKDPELCMKALCAVYRQQTAEEKSCRGTLTQNHRGFSKFDALRGTMIAEFLTDGDPHGDLKRSVEEFQEFDCEALELCRTLASRYSKQLFEIYQNKEDPFWC